MSEVYQRLDMKYLIRALVKYGASDLHLKVGRPPMFRINGRLVPAKMPDLTLDQALSAIHGVLTEKQVAQLEIQRQIDFSFYIEGYGRFRCNVYHQRGSIAAAVRMIPVSVPKIDELGVPAVLKKICAYPRGLCLVTGATGAGKSTTMAAMVQHINETEYVHILTIEDPIEFIYRDVKGSVTQREVGSDISDLTAGLYSGLRQDSDVIMIGELRDANTIQAAIRAAENGHLVLATLHTTNAKMTLEYIMGIVPPESRNQTRIQLASALVAVVSQQLVLTKDGKSRIPACEVMIKSPAIEEAILKGEIERIHDTISASNDYYEMQSMNQALQKLVAKGAITEDAALRTSDNPDDLRLCLSGVSRKDGFDMMNEVVTNPGITRFPKAS